MPTGQRKIIAVIGLAGAGKTEAIEYLMEMRGWPKVYFGEVTFDELRRRGMEKNEANERLVREGLRTELGPLIYAERMIEKVKALKGSASRILVESLYSWEESLRFDEEFGDAFIVIALHASPKVRYERLAIRLERPLTAKEAWERDKSQIENLHQAGPIAMADYLIVNEETREELRGNLDAVMRQIQ